MFQDGLASGSKKLFDMAANVSADLPAQKLNTDSGPELVPQLQIAVQTLSTYVGNLNNKGRFNFLGFLLAKNQSFFTCFRN